MRYSKQIRSISFLKANAGGVLRELNEQRGPIVITKNGKARAVLQDVVSYEETQEILALLPILARGEQQVAQGKVKPLAEVVQRLHKPPRVQHEESQ